MKQIEEIAMVIFVNLEAFAKSGDWARFSRAIDALKELFEAIEREKQK